MYKGVISSLALQDLYHLFVKLDSFALEINNTTKCWVKGVASEGIGMQKSGR